MSARSRLLAYLQQAGLSTPRAESNIDAFAHELLDSVRRDVDSLEDRMGGHLWAGDVRDLLNARDPHASAGSVRPDEEPT